MGVRILVPAGYVYSWHFFYIEYATRYYYRGRIKGEKKEREKKVPIFWQRIGSDKRESIPVAERANLSTAIPVSSPPHHHRCLSHSFL